MSQQLLTNAGFRYTMYYLVSDLLVKHCPKVALNYLFFQCCDEFQEPFSHKLLLARGLVSWPIHLSKQRTAGEVVAPVFEYPTLPESYRLMRGPPESLILLSCRSCSFTAEYLRCLSRPNMLMSTDACRASFHLAPPTASRCAWKSFFHLNHGFVGGPGNLRKTGRFRAKEAMLSRSEGGRDDKQET